jgi:hypothetical protein
MPFHIVALFLAIVVTPWLISRLFLQRHSWGIILAGWGPAMISINVVIPIILHLLVIPITPDSLSIAHGILAGLIGCLFICFKRPVPAEICDAASNRLFLSGAVIFAVLVLPLTYIAGIDTYKWQDLAGNIAVEQRISWLIHPLSLLGFTPRSYSSAQPLVLASIQILGHTGVDWGFYILSLAFGLTGFFGARTLGHHLFKNESSAVWLAILYMFSPVFMRYNYWATGRGLLLALLPVYLLIMLKIGYASSRWMSASLSASNRAGDGAIHLSGYPDNNKTGNFGLIPAWLLMTGLIMMSHKAGVVGALLIPVLLLVSPALALLRGRWGLWLAGLLVLAASLLLTNGQPITLTIRLLTRFGWLLPLALLAISTAPGRLLTPPFRTILAAGMGTLILSCTPDMYGALLALPFMACAATIGIEKINLNRSSRRPRMGGLVLILIPALAIVLNQMRDSPSESVYQAAQFIERHDPRGPFQIEAPGAARHQIQAYVTGCPRFTVQAGSAAQLEVRSPPPWTGRPAHDAHLWINYLRIILEVRDAHTDWYGQGDKVYSITIDGLGATPPNAKLLFTSGNVAVFE